jgi:hypothetical protein
LYNYFVEVSAAPTEPAVRPSQFSFNASLKVDFQASCVTSDGGLTGARELDERPVISSLST